MSEPTWLTADLGAAADLSPRSRADRMRHSPQNVHSKEEDGKDLRSSMLRYHTGALAPALMSHRL